MNEKDVKYFKRALWIVIGLLSFTILFPRQMVALASSTFESFFFAEDAAHTSGDNGYEFLGVRQSTTTEFTAGQTFNAGTDGDYANIKVSEIGAIFTHDVSVASTSLISAIDNTYNTANESAVSFDIDPAGYRDCELSFTATSSGVSTQELNVWVEPKNPGGTYGKRRDGYLGHFLIDDTVAATPFPITMPFSCPLRMFRYEFLCNANCSATNLIGIASTTHSMRN